MWVLVARERQPNAPYWPGRRGLAVVDAVVWPLLLVVLLSKLPAPIGLFGPVAGGVVLLYGLSRLRQALWENHRYTFTTWRLARFAVAILVVGAMLKFFLHA